MVPQATRRYPDRCVSAVWQPPSHLYSAWCQLGRSAVVRIDRHASRLSRHATDGDCDQCPHDARKHCYRRLHGRSRAGHRRVGSALRGAAGHSAGLHHCDRPGGGIPRRPRIRLDPGGVRHDHAAAGAGDAAVPARASDAREHARPAGQCAWPAWEHCVGAHNVGCGRADGAVLYRPWLQHSAVLQAAERVASGYAGTGIPAADRRPVRRPCGCCLWLRVPAVEFCACC